MAWTAILTAGAGLAGTALGGPGVGVLAGTAVNSLTGGADPGASGVCPNQPSVAELQAVIARWTPAERAEFTRLHAAANVNDPLNLANLPHLAWQLAGGSDCRVSSSTGKAWVAYYQALRNKYVTGAIGAEATYSPAAEVAAAQADAGIGAQVRSVLESILNTGKEIVTSTVSGAVAGARASTSGAATGAQAGTFATQNAIPLMGIAAAGALVVVLLLAFRK